jgi:hypothetical protein
MFWRPLSTDYPEPAILNRKPIVHEQHGDLIPARILLDPRGPPLQRFEDPNLPHAALRS